MKLFDCIHEPATIPISLHATHPTSQDLELPAPASYHIGLVHAPMPSLVSHLAAEESRNPISHFGVRHVARTRVCEHKDDLACDEHGPHSTFVAIVSMVRLNCNNHASWWSGRIASAFGFAAMVESSK